MEYDEISLSEIEKQMSDFLEEQIATCDFSLFRQKGYDIDSGKVNVDVKIKNEKVDVAVDMPLIVAKAGVRSTKGKHKIEVESKFGSLYNSALEIYNKEKKEAFLENYAIDVMYNYAPVTGVDFTCSPKVWNPQKVVDNLRDALSANVAALKTSSEKGKDYFAIPK